MSVSPPKRQDDDELSHIFNCVRDARDNGFKVTLTLEGNNVNIWVEKSLQKTDNQKNSDECVATNDSLVPIDTALKSLKNKQSYIYKPNFIFNLNFNMNILPVIKAASKSVPFLIFGVGLAGVAALLALVKTYGLTWNVALWGGIIILLLMTVLFLLSSAYSTFDKPDHPYHKPAFILVCFIGSLFGLTGLLLLTCAFFDQPKKLSDLVYIGSAHSDSAPASSKQSANSTRIIGHVYKFNYTPVKDANVVLSIINTGQKLTQLNGAFDFTVPNVEISDTILISVWANEIGYINRKFAKKDLSKACDIVLPLQKDSKPALPIVKADVSNICKSLLTPLKKYINSSNIIYAQYVKGYKFEDAKRLYNLDKSMNQLIRANTPLIPDSLSKEMGQLIQHLAIWTTAYENKVGSVSRESNSEFQIIYHGPKFPAEAAARILAIKECF